MSTYTTPKKTVLPISSIKGKDYLEVKWRIVWFREEHPDWSIETEIKPSQDSCLSKAIIRDASGRIIQTAHKFENKAGFPDFIEKSETGAIGRALANCGFGTQFTGDELDEGARIVDGPIEKPKSNIQSDPGNYAVQRGRLKSKQLKDCPLQDIKDYEYWLLNVAEKPLRGVMNEELDMVQAYLAKASINETKGVVKTGYVDPKTKWKPPTGAVESPKLFDDSNPPPINDDDLPF